MRNVHTLKGQKALNAFTQSTYDLENLEPAIGEALISGSAIQQKTILAQVVNLQRVLFKLSIHIRNKNRWGNHHGG